MACLVTENAAVMRACEGNDRGGRGQEHQGERGPVGGHVEERVLDGLGLAQQHRALPEVVDDQGRHHHEVPRDANGPLAEVPEIGIERFAAGDAQDDGPEGDEADDLVVEEEPDRQHRIERHQHGRIAQDVRQAQQHQDREPHQRDGTEGLADAAGAEALHGEQPGDDDQGDRDHPGMKRGGGHLQPLHRRQHGDRRGDHTVAVEDGRAEDADRHEHRL